MARRQQYKEASGVEWSHIIVDLKVLPFISYRNEWQIDGALQDQWAVSQLQELAKLEEKERAALAKLGLGMKEASSKEISKVLSLVVSNLME